MPDRTQSAPTLDPSIKVSGSARIQNLHDSEYAVVAAWSASQYVLKDRETGRHEVWAGHESPRAGFNLKYGPHYLEFVRGLSPSQVAESSVAADLGRPPLEAEPPAEGMLEAFSPVPQMGRLAKEYCGVDLPLQVLRSGAGYYLGTIDEHGPCSRESREYFPTQDAAESALSTGCWTQREHP